MKGRAPKDLPGPPAETSGLLRTSKLVKVYRADGVTVEAVRGVDLELAIGEFVAIMGPSGSGKSTLLHVLGGLEPATSGEIWLRGQRVALARALANEPSLLLADEPTGNLDSTNTRDVLRLLRRAHSDGQAILMVTHDARVASLADRVINLFDGMVADNARIVPIPRRLRGVGDIVELRG